MDVSDVSFIKRYVKMKIAYLIEPRVVRRWFRNNQVIYDLVKYSEEEIWDDPSYGNGDGHFLKIKTTKTIFSSQNIEQVIIIKQNLERV